MTYLDRPTPTRSGAWAHSTLGAVVHNALRAVFESPADQRTPERAAMLVRRYWTSEGFAGPSQAADYRARAGKWVADGREDRIDQRGGELVIIDYKTGRQALTVGDARDSLALALYALASRRTLHRRCTRVELHHLPTGQVVAWDHTEDSLARHLQRAEKLAEELQQATEAWEAGADRDVTFPARTGRHCTWCEFRAHCPEGQQAAPELAPWALLGE